MKMNRLNKCAILILTTIILSSWSSRFNLNIFNFLLKKDNNVSLLKENDKNTEGVVKIVKSKSFVKKDKTIVHTDPLPEVIDFNIHIKPILSDRCFKCHGPDKSKVEAGLQLTNFEGATAVLKSKKQAVVPFKPNESELVKRILSHDPEDMMPSPKSNLALNETEKQLLIKWIEQGGEYKEHWAFVVPFKYPLPVVKNTAWVKNAIDNFILKKLEEHGLTPANDANKEAIVRRLSFDLTGLPPTVDEINSYVNDSSTNAYEKLVDRLMATPQYGERMAMDWLDVARYADSHGYQDDGMRNAYPYRDWLIRAFNQNLGLDQFATWQLAGDLLPNPTNDQLTATCFNRNHMQTQEGGVVDEEYRVEYVADRVNTFSKAFLGLTFECARCHTHKYDPILHKDYYSMFAFFNTNRETGIVPYSGEASPTLLLIKDAVQKSLDSLHNLMKPHLEKTVSSQYKKDFENWLVQAKKKPISSEILRGRLVHFDFEPHSDSLVWDDVNPPTKEELEQRKKDLAKRIEEAKKDTTKKIQPIEKLKGFVNKDTSSLTRGAVLVGDKDRFPQTVEGKYGKGLSFKGDAGVQMGRVLDFEKNQPFTVSIWFKLLKEGENGPIFGKQNGEFEGNRGYLCKLNKDGTLNFQINHAYPANSIDFQTTEKIKVNEWTHLAMTYDGSSKAAGFHIFINGKTPSYRTHADNLQRSILHTAYPNTRNWSIAPFILGLEFRETLQNAEMDELQIWKRQLSDIEIAQVFENQDVIQDLISKVSNTVEVRNPDSFGKGSKENQEVAKNQLLDFYLLSQQNKIFNEHQDSLIALRFKETELMTDQEEVMIMQESKFPPKSYILNRGAYDAHGEEVSPNTPAKLLPFDEQKYPKNRLGLAQWLVDEKNPLFARVMANRYWQLMFGKGLVSTQEDFGNQGAMPSHLELLDWLAMDLRENKWDLKRFIKQIVMSSTYRQSSVPSAESKENDFLNDYYSRYPAHRLSAEQIRDNALASSGLLVKKIGGASVYPYQPAGIWEALATRNATVYVQNHGDSLYRRSMYTIIKRSAPPPAMLNFDATDRAYCVARRQKTASPLQALVLMNDPQFVEAARILGEKMMRYDPSFEKRITYCFQALTSRKPRTEELAELKKLYDLQYNYLKYVPQEAESLLSVGEYKRDMTLNLAELAACTVVATTLMNFDEFSMKR
jgi:Protein of unknown function (DUF1553)/Protein of unknown function (DUF1549)/Concanavalin A-like lectin/glucanases superfamily/Planctomycete cytochrome C